MDIGCSRCAVHSRDESCHHNTLSKVSMALSSTYFLKVSDLLILRIYANTENKHVSHGLPSACRPPDSALQHRPTRNTGGPGRPLPFLLAVHRLLHAAARSRNNGRGRWCI